MENRKYLVIWMDKRAMEMPSLSHTPVDVEVSESADSEEVYGAILLAVSAKDSCPVEAIMPSAISRL